LTANQIEVPTGIFKLKILKKRFDTNEGEADLCLDNGLICGIEAEVGSRVLAVTAWIRGDQASIPSSDDDVNGRSNWTAKYSMYVKLPPQLPLETDPVTLSGATMVTPVPESRFGCALPPAL